MNIITLRISIDLDETTPVQLVKSAGQEELILKAEPLAAITVREQMRKAGRARASQITRAERIEYGRRAWLTRLARAKSISPATTAGE